MEFAICTVAAAPVRKEPSHRAEMTNQLLFGETVQVLEQQEEWYRIKSLYDDYEGWLTHHLLTFTDAQTATADCPYVTTGLLNPCTLPDELINLPTGSSLTGFDEETRLLWDEQYKYHGTYRCVQPPLNEEELLRTAFLWLNAPYLWGGKTFMGTDCSGFVQTVFKVAGSKLKRDAYQQAEQGEPVENIAEAKKGDLAFFQNGNGNIIHVGILLNDYQIIHASGKVRIDRFSEEGIIHKQSGKRTHRFHSIKRFIN